MKLLRRQKDPKAGLAEFDVTVYHPRLTDLSCTYPRGRIPPVGIDPKTTLEILGSD